MTLPDLHKAILIAKTKSEAGAAMRKFISQSGGWSDGPPELFEKLEQMFPLKTP